MCIFNVCILRGQVTLQGRQQDNYAELQPRTTDSNKDMYESLGKSTLQEYM